MADLSHNFGGHTPHGTHASLAAEAPFAAGQLPSESHGAAAGGEASFAAAGHLKTDAQGNGVGGGEPLSRDGQAHHAAHSKIANPANPLVDGGCLPPVTQFAGAVIDEIIELWRQRQAWHRAEKSLTLQAKAVCRRFAGGDKKQAERLYAAATIGVVSSQESAVAAAIAPLVEARDGIEKTRKVFEKYLIKQARTLPVWSVWAKDVRGFAELSLVAVVGECGDLSNYANPAKIWKRMGLAVIDGQRQRRVSGDDAILHGYNPQRRSVAWNLGSCIIKVGGETSPYRALYDARKVIEAERVETKGHAHNRAARYMTKRLLRDLWVAWRAAARAINPAEATRSLLSPPLVLEDPTA